MTHATPYTHLPVVPCDAPFLPLVERIRREATVVDNRIVRIDHFLNHRIEPLFMRDLGQAMAERIHRFRPELILTAESSGIAPALATAGVLNLPLVYAKKYAPDNPSPPLARVIASPTRGGEIMLRVAEGYLTPGMRIALVDDFLAQGGTALALADIVAEAGAELVVTGFVVEKQFQDGRAGLVQRGLPIATLARITQLQAGSVIMAGDRA